MNPQVLQVLQRIMQERQGQTAEPRLAERPRPVAAVAALHKAAVKRNPGVPLFAAVSNPPAANPQKGQGPHDAAMQKASKAAV